MIYEDDKEKKLIIDLCDLALKTGGLQNKEAVDYILHHMRPLVKENEPLKPEGEDNVQP